MLPLFLKPHSGSRPLASRIASTRLQKRSSWGKDASGLGGFTQLLAVRRRLIDSADAELEDDEDSTAYVAKR